MRPGAAPARPVERTHTGAVWFEYGEGGAAGSMERTHIDFGRGDGLVAAPDAETLFA